MTCLAQQGISCLITQVLPSGIIASVIIGSVAGFLIGLFHFASLKWVAARLVQGDYSVILLQLLRFGLLVTVFWVLALMGWQALLTGLAGNTLARALILARDRQRS